MQQKFAFILLGSTFAGKSAPFIATVIIIVASDDELLPWLETDTGIVSVSGVKYAPLGNNDKQAR